MAIVYSNGVKQARMQAVADAVPGGKIKVYTTGKATLLAVWTLPNPAGSASGAVLTWDCDPDLSTTGVGAGDAAVAEITTAADVVEVDGLTAGDVGTEDLVLDNATIAIGQTVTLATGTFTHAA